MKKLLYLFLVLGLFACSDDSIPECYEYIDYPINCSGTPYQSIIYGTQEWTVENACHTTYRDGTPIPQVSDGDEWKNLEIGAWCYFDNDPSKGKLYNWYAVMGIHDAASFEEFIDGYSTLRKEFAPEGWHVPSDEEFIIFNQYLCDNGYNSRECVSSSDKYPIAKAISSQIGWKCNRDTYIPDAAGYYPETNNSSGFNAYPVGVRFVGWDGGSPSVSDWMFRGEQFGFWTSSESYTGGTSNGYYLPIVWGATKFTYLLDVTLNQPVNGNPVRLVKD